MKLLCQVFRSPRRQEMYLYVDKARGLEDVPEVLMNQFGEPEAVMTSGAGSSTQAGQGRCDRGARQYRRARLLSADAAYRGRIAASGRAG